MKEKRGPYKQYPRTQFLFKFNLISNSSLWQNYYLKSKQGLIFIEVNCQSSSTLIYKSQTKHEINRNSMVKSHNGIYLYEPTSQF